MPDPIDVVRLYFEGLAAGDLARIPYAENVELRAPLAPQGLAEPIAGAAAVRAYLGGVLPLIDRVEILNLFQNGEWAAGRAHIRLKQPVGAVLRVMDVFKVVRGRIVFQENHFDPRPVLAG